MIFNAVKRSNIYPQTFTKLHLPYINIENQLKCFGKVKL